MYTKFHSHSQNISNGMTKEIILRSPPTWSLISTCAHYTLHYTRYILHTTLHYTTLHYTTLHYTTHYTLHTTLHTTLHYTTHYNTQHYALHYTILHTTIHNTTHYTLHSLPVIGRGDGPVPLLACRVLGHLNKSRTSRIRPQISQIRPAIVFFLRTPPKTKHRCTGFQPDTNINAEM